MSLLADLLSRTKTGSSRDGAETSTPLNVPPTLSKAHGIPSKVRWFSNRYVVIGVVCAVFIGIGVFVALKSRQVSSLAKKTVPVPAKPAPPLATAKVEPIAPVPPLVPLAPPVAPKPAAPPSTAKIKLEEPPAPVAPQKKPRVHTVKRTRHPVPKPVAKAAAEPKSDEQVPAQQLEKPQKKPQQTRQKSTASPRMDTAARDSFLYAARSAEQTADWKSALASYRRAQELDPGDYKIMSNLSAVLNNLGMFDESVREAERALAKKQDYVPALINAAIGYSSRGNTQKALRLFSYASVLDPGNRNLVINLGILYERSGSLDDALATYRPLAGSGDVLVLQGLSRVYERKGNKPEAMRVYRQIMALPNASEKLRKEVKGKLTRLEE